MNKKLLKYGMRKSKRPGRHMSWRMRKFSGWLVTELYILKLDRFYCQPQPFAMSLIHLGLGFSVYPNAYPWPYTWGIPDRGIACCRGRGRPRNPALLPIYQKIEELT